MKGGEASDCGSCAASSCFFHERLGIDLAGFDAVIALAGNPNTGKSTLFNALTGLRQHTGNWPGKTVTRAEGGFAAAGRRFKIVDLPGCYSLLATSPDEEAARDFLLFGRPDVTVVVLDATCLERNLNLCLQVLEITPRVVLALNLIDEAERRGFDVDARSLSRKLGVPVVPIVARSGRGLPQLIEVIAEVSAGTRTPQPSHRLVRPGQILPASEDIEARLLELWPGLPASTWIALRLIEGDDLITAALRSGELGTLSSSTAEAPGAAIDELLHVLEGWRWRIGPGAHEALTEALYAEAGKLADTVVSRRGDGFRIDRAIDRLLTGRLIGLPLMVLILAAVLWLTILGANWPSRMLGSIFLDAGHPALRGIFEAIGAPWWLTGVLVDGVYLATAWVVSVMLPPMAIFFPLFTILEDLGYLPRVAFNLDGLFQRAGAHGKQALTMAMGFGCNAAGVVSSRIISSPRERLIAIVTNNFALCNGRWPTQILIATIFLGALAPPALAGLVSASAVLGVALLGIALTFATSWLLSQTVLRGEVSAFSLELPPYRPPRILQVLWTSLIDRTLFVLWRAVVFAAPAGALIWLVANVEVSGALIADHATALLDGPGTAIGLSGIILLAYIIAIPANEIVIPTILMLISLSGRASGAGQGVMFELDSLTATGAVLEAGGFTLLTAVNLMLFSLVHNPCSTTIYTTWKETRSLRWTTLTAVLPLVMGLVLCFVVTQCWRLVLG